jgi:hypothetical protein
MANELTAWLELKDGTQVRVKVCAFEEPALPTPNEPEIARVPTLYEWPAIVAKMARLEFSRIESQAP